MLAEQLTRQANAAKEFFDRSTGCLEGDDASFTPADGMMTAAQQIAHVAQTIDWFIEGASRREGFDMDFEKHMASIQKIQTLDDARAWYAKAHQALIEFIGSKSDEELMSPLPDGPVMGGAPRMAIVGAVDDHTAHHRGALTVYSRLIGKTPAMPYM